MCIVVRLAIVFFCGYISFSGFPTARRGKVQGLPPMKVNVNIIESYPKLSILNLDKKSHNYFIHYFTCLLFRSGKIMENNLKYFAENHSNLYPGMYIVQIGICECCTAVP